MKSIKRAFVALAVSGVALGVQAQEKVTLSIATGPTTGVYYPLGGGIANVLSKYVPGYAANAESTAGSVASRCGLAHTTSRSHPKRTARAASPCATVRLAKARRFSGSRRRMATSR